MEAIQQADLSSMHAPLGGDRVYKDECIYSYQTPEREGGLYVSLSSFFGVGPDYLSLHHRKTGEPLYLHITRVKKPSPPKSHDEGGEGEAPPAKKPTRLALGVEGGFDGGVEEEEWEDKWEVVVMPSKASVPLPNDQLPQKVTEAIAGVLAAPTASKVDAIAAWEGDKRKVSQYATSLVQLDNGVKVPPSGWKCAKCDLTTNLWLNLTDGTILCGRRYWDGSGGNNHAVDHYEATGFPLAVKLGTITPGGADVYSYGEDDMVEDTLLSQHLQHFGINIANMTKTDATMTELEIEANMRIGEWSIIQEAGKELTPCFGAGYTGLANLGNSCYLNSVMQVLFSLPEFQERYYSKAEQVFSDGPPDAAHDFNMQMCKFAVGLLSGRYSQPPKEDVEEGKKVEEAKEGEKKRPKGQKGIRAGMFKTLIGRGHAEFSTNRQQDAPEFFLHLLSAIERAERAGSGGGMESLLSLFRFQVEEKIQCTVSGQVRYTTRDETILQLPVAIESATNKSEYEEWQKKKAELQANKQRIKPEDEVRAKVPFASCLAQFAAPVHLSDFYSTAVQAKSPATKITRFAMFPDYLVLQLNKYFLGDDWTPKKYDVEIDVPNELDLSSLRGCGLQPGEVQLPEGEAPANQAPAVEVDEAMVMQLASMGFDVEGCKRAVYHTQSQGVEAAMNWVLEHMGDPDFATPFVPPQQAQSSQAPSSEASEDNIAMVMALGFSREQAVKALKATGNNIERAADWVFSHAGELDAMETEEPAAQDPRSTHHDGPGKYRLFAFVSHIGTSTATGHYVCHIKKEGRWVIFNDEKVAESMSPPVDHAYMYFYQRMRN